MSWVQVTEEGMRSLQDEYDRACMAAETASFHAETNHTQESREIAIEAWGKVSGIRSAASRVGINVNMGV